MPRISLSGISILCLILVSCAQAARFEPLLLSDITYDLGSGEYRTDGFGHAYLNAAGQAVVEVDRVWNPIGLDSGSSDSDTTSSSVFNVFSSGATILALGERGPKVVATTLAGLTSDERDDFRLQVGASVGFNPPNQYLSSGLNIDSEGNAVFVGLSDHLGTRLSGKPLWRGDGTTLNRIDVEPLPGVDEFPRTELSGPLVSISGTLAFGGLSIRQNPALDIRSTVWRNSIKGITLVAQEGSPADGLEKGLNFGSVGMAGLNGSGDILLRGWAWRGVRGELTDGIWLASSSNATRLIASKGQQAPGAADGVEFAFNMFPSIGGSTVAFSATTIDINGLYGSGIWADRGEGLEKIAASGDALLSDQSDRIFTMLGSGYEPAVNSRGDVSFQAWSNEVGAGAVGSNPGLWIDYAESGLTSIVQRGELAPGLEAGTEFDRPSEPALLSNGDTLFTASLRGDSITDENRLSLWRYDEEGVLTLLLRTGDLLELGNGDRRQVAYFAFAGLGTGTDDGKSRSFNDAGQIALSVNFTDETSGVVLYHPTAIPEPSTIILSTFVWIASIARRRDHGTQFLRRQRVLPSR